MEVGERKKTYLHFYKFGEDELLIIIKNKVTPSRLWHGSSSVWIFSYIEKEKEGEKERERERREREGHEYDKSTEGILVDGDI